MNTIDDSLKAFERFLESVSDEKLDNMISKIDQMGIEGPSVDDYFSKINDSIASFYNIDYSEAILSALIEECFSDTRVSDSAIYTVPTSELSQPIVISVPEVIIEFSDAGESYYPMAA
jgi:hypothetical protein